MAAVLVVLSAQVLKIIRNHPEHTAEAVKYFTSIAVVAVAFVVAGLFLVDFYGRPTEASEELQPATITLPSDAQSPAGTEGESVS